MKGLEVAVKQLKKMNKVVGDGNVIDIYNIVKIYICLYMNQSYMQHPQVYTACIT